MMRSVLLAMALIASSCSSARAEDALFDKLVAMAERGNAEALYHVGMAYQTGTGTGEDPKTAFTYFERAAAAGDPLGAYKVGCVWDGQGELVKPDMTKALRYKLVAAEAGYALAQQDVGALYYRQGQTDLALKWLAKAAAQGTQDAIMTYASVHNGAEGIQKNPVITAAYFRIMLNRLEGGSDEQKQWLAKFETDLSPDQRAEATQIAASFQPNPTPITLKALSGLAAAEALIAKSESK